MSAEPVGEEVVEDDETVDADLVRDLVVQLNSMQERMDDLEAELEQTQRLNEALRARILYSGPALLSITLVEWLTE